MGSVRGGTFFLTFQQILHEKVKKLDVKILQDGDQGIYHYSRLRE